MARPSLFTHRKFAHLEFLIGSRIGAAGVLELIWHRAYTDGDPVLGLPEVVEHSIGWTGEPGSCVDALVKAGFVELADDGQVTVHDLDDHAPSYVKKRKSREAERRQRPDSDQSVTGQRKTVTTPPAPAPAPAPAPKKNTLPRRSDKKAIRQLAISTGFGDWWDHYGKRGNKQEAEWAWVQLSVDDQQKIGVRTSDYLLRRLQARAAGAFVPIMKHGSTFLNNAGWEEEFPLDSTASGGREADQTVGTAPTSHPWHPDDVAKYGQPGSEHERWFEYVGYCEEMPPHEWPAKRFKDWLED